MLLVAYKRANLFVQNFSWIYLLEKNKLQRKRKKRNIIRKWIKIAEIFGVAGIAGMLSTNVKNVAVEWARRSQQSTINWNTAAFVVFTWLQWFRWVILNIGRHLLNGIIDLKIIWLFDLTLCRYSFRNIFTLVKPLHHPTLPKLCTTSGHRIRKMVKFIIKIIWNASETSILLKQSKPNKNSVHSTASKKSLVFSSCFFLSIGFFSWILGKCWSSCSLNYKSCAISWCV